MVTKIVEMIGKNLKRVTLINLVWEVYFHLEGKINKQIMRV